MYTLRAVPVPVPLRALTAGYQSARFSFMAEPVFQLRKWLIMIAGVFNRASAMYNLIEPNDIVCMYDRRFLAWFILDAAGVHCYVWTRILHHCERQAVFNGVTV